MHSATPTGECRSWNAHASLLCILILISVFLVGCGQEPVYIASGTYESDTDAINGGNISDDAGTSDPGGGIDTDDSIEAGDGLEAGEATEVGDDTAVEGTGSTVCVYVCGAVVSPGLYTLDEGSRIYDAIAAAGGLREDASEDYWNQAAYVSDGQMIDVPTEEEVEAGVAVSDGGNTDTSDSSATGQDTDNTRTDSSGADAQNTGSQTEKININTATAAELTQIPGIGEARAEAVISYREQSGGFDSIEDIKNVSGIGDALFEKMKDYIEV